MLELLSSIVRASLRNRPMVLLATLLFFAIGLRAAFLLPMDAVPDVTNVQVQIITSAPALSPVEVEQYISVPVERAMAGLPRMNEVRSLSKYGISVVTLGFEDGTDLYFARQLILERMAEAEEAVPKQYGRPEMGPIATGLGEIFQFTVTGEGQSLMALKEVLDWEIAPQLRMVPGVIEVNSFGGEAKEYQVVLDPHRLQASGLSVQEVVDALERSNGNAGGGYIERNREQLVVGTSGQVKDLEDLRAVVVGATAQGVPITVASIADVRFGARLRRGAASMDGKGEVVVGVAMMLRGENSRTVAQAVKQKLEELAPSMPEGTKVVPFYDRAALVDRTLRTVGKNLAEGALLVVLMLLLLLGDVRAGLIVALTIPLSMLFAVTVMSAFGMSGNLMSLGAIDFGLIVDGAVIIVENAVRRLSEARVAQGRALTDEERVNTVERAAVEVRGASVFGELIIATVYLPVLALQGTEGKLFQPMAVTVLLALAGAFIISLTVIPVLSSYFLVPAEHPRETWLMRALQRAYTPIFSRAWRHPRVTLGTGVVLLALAIAVFVRLGAEFVPQLDEGDLLVEARRLPGIALSESIATDHRLQSSALTVPEVAHVVSKTGAPDLATDPMGVEQTDVYLQLKPQNEWRAGMHKEDVGEAIHQALERDVPEVAGALSQPIQMRTNELVAGVKSDVAAHLYGPDLDILQTLADKMGERLSKVEGARDVRVERGAGLGHLRIQPDRSKLARYGLTLADVNLLTETIAVGRQTGQVFEQDRRFALTVRMNDHAVRDLESIRSLPLKASSGQVVPLGDVAQVEVEEGPAVVNREKQSRRRTVELNVEGRDLVSVVQAAQKALSQDLKLPAGYRIEWGGQFQNYLRARTRLAFIVPVALALIFFFLWLAFRSFTPALLIFANIPFAVIGGVFALAVRGLPFSISAGVGFIALFGVAVLNGLVLVSFAREREAQGESATQSIQEAARLRLRPVLMTALVAALGFIPMALSRAPGSEVQRPLATVVIGGLVSATALTLLLFPVLYGRIASKRKDERHA
ncbi:MAG: efflux RND transporter permease subunit [Myxococcaceae bacterium]